MAVVDQVPGRALDVLDTLIATQEAALRGRTRRSHELHLAAGEHLPGGVAFLLAGRSTVPVFLERGLGSRVWDVDGTEYVDLHGGFGTMLAGHGHDTVQVSVYPDAADSGDPDQPATVRRVRLAHPGEIAGMVIEPVMMHIGVCHRRRATSMGLHTHGALLTFDEVKTGLAIAPGGAIERFGVVPDIVCLAKALGGGVPYGAIGGTAEVMDAITTGTYEQVGTFNGNPLTMAAAKATLFEVLTPAG
jgi:glutamate-1-semialdehyde aminotransferase